ncbi:MAG: arylesterase [Rhodobacteraceae bacterium]|nr:arylesterase [Paracoccaceae bacterium]
MFVSKRSFITILLTTILLCVACPANADSRKLLIIGDSLSAGYGLADNESWTTLLQNRLSANGYIYQVVNASISGDTTGGGLRRLPRALQIHAPEIVLIELGGNDGLRGTPIAIIRKNLATMIKLGQQAGAQVILAGMIMPPNYGQTYTDGFADIYSELAKEYDAPLIKFFMKNVAINPGLMQADQIHPNAAGQPYLLNNVWATLEHIL